MCEEEKIEEKLEFLMKLQCKLVDDVRREIEKLRKTINGEKHPVSSMNEDVRRLFHRKSPQPEIPMDDRI